MPLKPLKPLPSEIDENLEVGLEKLSQFLESKRSLQLKRKPKKEQTEAVLRKAWIEVYRKMRKAG